MAIKIGHASISEKGTITGNAGDQTGKEVCVRTWYSKPWGFVLRCKDALKAEKMANACEAGCSNNNIGYDQNQRNTAHTKAKAVGYDLSKIKEPCETDCSAFMTLCAIAAGVSELEYTGNAPTTSTMQKVFKATGQFDVLTDSKYLTSDKYLIRGDILVRAGSHTVMALENGSEAVKETVQYYPRYTGTSTSIVVALQAVKVDSNFNYRKKIAAVNNITGYTGTASQNTQMLNLLKQGKLKKA